MNLKVRLTAKLAVWFTIVLNLRKRSQISKADWQNAIAETLGKVQTIWLSLFILVKARQNPKSCANVAMLGLPTNRDGEPRLPLTGIGSNALAVSPTAQENFMHQKGKKMNLPNVRQSFSAQKLTIKTRKYFPQPSFPLKKSGQLSNAQHLTQKARNHSTAIIVVAMDGTSPPKIRKLFMTTAQLTHGDLRQVGEYLNTKNGVTQDELHSALLNAITEIMKLQNKVSQLEQSLHDLIESGAIKP